MSSICKVTARAIEATFREEVDGLSGEVSSVEMKRSSFYARAVLPLALEVARGDKVRGGVALRAEGDLIQVCPYIFRIFCRNGSVFAQAFQTWTEQHVGRRDPAELANALRDAVRSCGSEQAFAAAGLAMRESRLIEVDNPARLVRAVQGSHMVESVIRAIIGRHMVFGDLTRFGLMNAVTSLARDTRDPELAWRLEDLGGRVAMAPRPREPELPVERAERCRAVGR